MKKYVVFVLIVMSFALLLSACSLSEEEKIQSYLEKNSEGFYRFSVADFTDGKLNIEIEMLANSETWSNEAIKSDMNIETKATLEAVKKYSAVHVDAVKEVNLFFVTRESNKTVAEIYAHNETIVESNWKKVTNQDLPKTVDGYKFYGVST